MMPKSKVEAQVISLRSNSNFLGEGEFLSHQTGVGKTRGHIANTRATVMTV